jgi:hypothetical protein
MRKAAGDTSVICPRTPAQRSPMRRYNNSSRFEELYRRYISYYHHLVAIISSQQDTGRHEKLSRRVRERERRCGRYYGLDDRFVDHIQT